MIMLSAAAEVFVGPVPSTLALQPLYTGLESASCPCAWRTVETAPGATAARAWSPPIGVAGWSTGCDGWVPAVVRAGSSGSGRA